MTHKKAIYYEDVRGKKPVKEFITKFDEKTMAKILARVEFLETHWYIVSDPFK